MKKHTIVNIQYYQSPCGELVLASVGNELCLCDWSEHPCAEHNMRRLVRMLNATFVEETSEVLQRFISQLDEYFRGERRGFDVSLHFVGTEFQKQVWRALLKIPYGEVRIYKDIAIRVNNIKGVRAVAQAIGANGMSIVVPCHRVIGSNHALTGFAGGLDAKRTLLKIEGSDDKIKVEK